MIRKDDSLLREYIIMLGDTLFIATIYPIIKSVLFLTFIGLNNEQ